MDHPHPTPSRRPARLGRAARTTERGTALLEALVALAILSAAGIGVVGVMSTGLRSERELIARERQAAAADRVLSAMALLTGEDLDRRIGVATVGEFSVSVQRPEPLLYRIAVAPRETRSHPLLVTVVYRPRVPTE